MDPQKPTPSPTPTASPSPLEPPDSTEDSRSRPSSARGREDLPVIGWKEYVDLPQLGVSGLKAKIDTGARTSALHVENLREVESLEDGTTLLEFEVPLDRSGSRRVASRARCLRHIEVRDSGGHPETRPVIETEMVLGEVRKAMLLTLTRRRGMLFRMLLGRKTLEDSFLVDVGRKYLLGKPSRDRSQS